MLRRRPPRSTTCPSDPVGGPGRLRPERILRHAGDGAAAPAAIGRAIERTPPLHDRSGGVCLLGFVCGRMFTGVFVCRGRSLDGDSFAGRDVRRAFIRAADRNRPERLSHAVTPSCGACGSEHAEPCPCLCGNASDRSMPDLCPCLCGNASDRSLLPTLPDGSGGSSRRGGSAAFMAGAWRGSGLSLRPVALRALSFARGGHAAIRRGIFRASPCRPAGGCRPRPLRRRSCRPPRSPCPP